MVQNLEPEDPEAIEPKIGDCPIWENFLGRKTVDEEGLLEIYSLRTGGSYRITQQAADFLGLESTKYSRIRDQLTTWLIDQRVDDVVMPLVTPEVINYVKNRRRLRVAERADRLLTYLVEEAYELGHVIAFTDLPADVAEFLSGGDGTLKHTTSHDVNLRAYAWTESNDWDAVGALLDFLEQHLMIARTESIHRQQGWHIYTVTVNGYARVEEIQSIVASRQAFVAMWFDSSMDEVYENGIQPAIEATGFSAKVINRDPTVEKIDDAIIAEIRKSKFIVADFTHGDDGARGGVYFEAGFAMGLGIPVIFTCRGDMITKVHFDTRQYNHIVWNDLDELRRRLEERIRARIT